MARYYPVLFVFFVLCLYLLLGFAHPNTALTQDLGRHLLLGEMITRSFEVPSTNLFSYTYPDFPFINSHYLSEVIFWLITSIFGIESLLFFSLILIFITFALLFHTAHKSASLLGISLASVLLFRVWFERTDVRPELLSFLLTAIFISFLYRNRSKPNLLIYLLIPLSFLWTQLHIYFAIGCFLIFLFLLDGLISKQLRSKSQYIKTLSIVFVASCLVTILNPNGLDGTLYPIQVFENYGYTIEENQTPFFLRSLGFEKPSFPYFIASVGLLFLSFFLSMKKTLPIDWLLAISFTFIASSAVRNFPLFAIILLIPFARSLTATFTTVSKNLTKHQTRIATYAFILGLGIFLLWQMADTANIKGIGFNTTDPGRNAVTFFAKNHIPGPFFNNFDIGSYLIYRLYPDERVFVDGRPEAYPAAFFQNIYIPMQESPEMFATVSDEYNFNSIIFSHTDQTPWAKTFLYAIVRDPGWVTVFLDPTMIILIKNTPENSSLISRYGMEFETVTFSGYEKNNLDTLLSAANFAATINHLSLQKKVYSDILRLDPSFCPVLLNLAQILSAENDPTAIIYTSKYSQTCVR